MNTTNFLTHLENVRPRGAGQWSASCPAHDDNSPSLSIAEADGRILLHCHASCDNSSICAAIGISLKDLFIGSAIDPRDVARHKAQRERQRRNREQKRHAEGRLLDACKHADQFLESRRDIDISAWSDDRLDRELDLVADAYQLLEHDPYGY